MQCDDLLPVAPATTLNRSWTPQYRVLLVVARSEAEARFIREPHFLPPADSASGSRDTRENAGFLLSRYGAEGLF